MLTGIVAGGKGKTKPYSLFWEVISEVRKIFCIRPKDAQKMPHSLQSDISMFRVQQ